MSFPVSTDGYKPLSLDPASGSLTDAERKQLQTNIDLYRDVIIFFTTVAGAKGLSGHAGGPYSIVPETLIAEGFMRGSDKVYPVCFDEAGHRVAIQYALAAFNEEIPFEKLLHYREADHGLYGHPELDPELGIKFSSGRLGHMWPFINGVARAYPDKNVMLLASDGSQMEGNDAEAARLAVAYNLNVTILVDDNNVTISGHPHDYLHGYDIERTLKGHGLNVTSGDPENIDELYTRIHTAVKNGGPNALINRRPMAPGIAGVEGSHKGHEVIPVDAAVEYLENRGQSKAAEYLKGVSKISSSTSYRGCSTEKGSNRKEFGKVLAEILEEMPEKERTERVMVIDSDLEGSTGLNTVGERVPEVYVRGGVMERGNFSAAAGFGFEKGRQGVFSTFSAFTEMVVSEITMARLNKSNVLSHFSHAGVDDIADNTCHYGINVFFTDSGVEEISKDSRLYFPADTHQLRAIVKRVFNDPGLRFVFSTRSTVPYVLTEDGSNQYFSPDSGYEFEPDKDEVILEGTAGYIVTYGEMLHRAMDSVVQLRESGVNVGLVNKPTLNVVDEESMKRLGNSPAVLLVEAQNSRTGLGTRFGTWLLERGQNPRYAHMGTHRQGAGGLAEHILHQGLGTENIKAEFQKLIKG